MICSVTFQPEPIPSPRKKIVIHTPMSLLRELVGLADLGITSERAPENGHNIIITEEHSASTFKVEVTRLPYTYEIEPDPRQYEYMVYGRRFYGEYT
jgi:hypothetical protein